MLTGELVALFLGVSLLMSILQALISEEQIRSLMGRAVHARSQGI